MKIKYKRITVEVEGERPKKCCVCGKKFKKIDLHHIKYAYSTKEVKKNPQLALENTIPVCYYDHKIADSLRKLTENPEKAQKIIDIIKENYESKL